MQRHARVDDQGVLLEWGLSDYANTGIPVAADFASTPGTVRWDGAQWVAIPQPDGRGFEVALHDIFGAGFLTFIAAFPAAWLFLDSIRTGAWAQAQGLIQLALSQQAITQQEYDAIKAAAATYQIPVTL